MRSLILVCLLLGGWLTSASAADTYTFNVASGDWNTPGNWLVNSGANVGNTLPSTADDVTIPLNDTVTAANDGSNGISGFIYNIAANNLTVQGTLILKADQPTSIQGQLQIGNNLTVNGTVNVGGQTAGNSNDLITFQSASPTISGTGTINILGGGSYNIPTITLSDGSTLTALGIQFVCQNLTLTQNSQAIAPVIDSSTTPGTIQTPGTEAEFIIGAGATLTLNRAATLNCLNGVSLTNSNSGVLTLVDTAQISWPDNPPTNTGVFSTAGNLNWEVSSATTTAITGASVSRLGGTLSITVAPSRSISDKDNFYLFYNTFFQSNLYLNSDFTTITTNPTAITYTTKGASDTSFPFTVSLANATVTIDALSASPKYGDVLSPTVHRNGPIYPTPTWTTSDPTVIAINASNQPVVTGVGIATITAHTPADNSYLSGNGSLQITTTKRTVTVSAADQSRVYGAANPTNSLNVSGLAPSDTVSALGTPTYFYASPATATTAPGTIGITVLLPANPDYTFAYGPSGTLTITQAPQTISFPALANLPPTQTFVLPQFSSAGLPISYSSSDITKASISVDGSGVSTLLAVAVTSSPINITATQAGNANYLPATAVVQPLTIGLITQSITGISATRSMFLGDVVNLPINATSGLPISYTFTPTTPAIISITGSNPPQLTALGTNGLDSTTIVVTASQPGNASYAAATPVQQTITVSKKPQTVTFTSPTLSSVTVLQTPTLAATSSSGETVTFTSSDLTKATISGSTLNALSPGTVTITASAPGDATYLTASATLNVTIVPQSPQVISGFSIPTTMSLNDILTLAATSNSGLAVTYVSSDSTIATISGTNNNILTAVGLGPVTITASQAGNAFYLAAANVTQSTTVNKRPQTVTFTSPATNSSVTVLQTPTLVATSSSSETVTFTSSDLTKATISGSTLNALSPGTVTITASVPGDATYQAASATISITIVPQSPQVISGFSIPATMTLNDTLTLAATSNSGLAVTYTSSDSTVATVSGTNNNILTAVGIGPVTITASQAGNAFYLPATNVTLSTIVNKLTQTVTFPGVGPLIIGQTGTLAATTPSGLAITYASSDTTIAQISGTTVTAIAPGTAVITATAAGDNTHQVGTATITLTVTNKLSQTVTFASIPNLTVGSTGTLVASSSAGLPITFTVSDGSIVTLSGTTVIGTQAGNTTITANQAGDATHLAASATQSVTVAAATAPPTTTPAGTAASGGGCGSGSGIACILGLLGLGLRRLRRA
jgi:MBG domain (YGX type)